MKIGCEACELTLATACAQALPLPLCGLCKLMGPEEAFRYFARWNRTAAEALAVDVPRKRERAA